LPSSQRSAVCRAPGCSRPEARRRRPPNTLNCFYWSGWSRRLPFRSTTAERELFSGSGSVH